MAPIYALDTNICIWAMRDECFPELKKDFSSEVEDKRKRAIYLLKALDYSKAVTVIPSIVLAEIIIPLTRRQQDIYMDKVSKVFEIIDFDAIAAARYVEMWQKHSSDGLIKKHKGDNISNREIKLDHAIAATCLAHRVTCVYSSDAKLRNFCTGFLEAKDLPAFPEQQNVNGDWELDASAMKDLKDFL